MAEPSTALGRQAAFAANFLGTTNLAQRRRYQEDIQAAEMQDEALMEQQFAGANRAAELADPLKARQLDLAERKARIQETQFERNMRMRQNAEALQLQRFSLEEKKADYTIKKAIREQDMATRMLADTDAVEQADYDLRKSGFLPGSKPYAAGMVSAFAAHPHVDPDYRRTMWKAAEIEDDPDEAMSEMQKEMKNPVVTGFVTPEGKKRYTVRETAQEQADPRKLRRDLEKDLNSINDRLLSADPAMKPYWAKRIKETEAELLKLDSGGQQQPAATSPASQAPATDGLVPRKAKDGTVWLFDPATKQPVRRAE